MLKPTLFGVMQCVYVVQKTYFPTYCTLLLLLSKIRQLFQSASI